MSLPLKSLLDSKDERYKLAVACIKHFKDSVGDLDVTASLKRGEKLPVFSMREVLNNPDVEYSLDVIMKDSLPAE